MPDRRRGRGRGQGPTRLGDVLGEAVSEAQFQEWVLDCAARGGWAHWHFADSRRPGPDGTWVGDAGAAGFPDLVLAKPGYGVLFVELKKQGKYPTPTQRKALRALAAAGGMVTVWRPRDADVVQRVLLHNELAAGDWLEAA